MPVLKPIRGFCLNKSHPLARGLVGCWLMNEGTGSTIFDLSGNESIGSWDIGSAMWSAGKFGSAIKMDGDDGIHLGTGPSMSGNVCFSVVFWMKTATSAEEWIISQFNGGYQNVWIVRIKDNKLGFCLPNKFIYYTSDTSVNDDCWHQIVCTYDQSDFNVYIDSILDKSSPAGAVSFDGNISCSIGFNDRDDSNYFNGRLDHIILFSHVLSVSEIALLYREPFCMFGRRVRPEILYIPEAAVSLEGSIGAQSTTSGSMSRTSSFEGSIDSTTELSALVKIISKVSGTVAGTSEITALLKTICRISGSAGGEVALDGSLSITGEVLLAGIINSGTTLTGMLTLGYYDPWTGGLPEIERNWIREALFNGMTANAYKLGTTLSLGWFWLRVAGCSALYRGFSMGEIDFVNILAAAEIETCELSPPKYIPHNNNSMQFYVVRRFNGCGYQEHTLDAAVKISIDSNGNLTAPQPNNIFGLKVEKVCGNKIRLVWFYCPIEQKSRPMCFNVYCDDRTGQIDYQNPLATFGYQGRKFYSYQSNSLEAGKYLFSIKAEDAEGVENNSLTRLRIQLDTIGFDAINILKAEAV